MGLALGVDRNHPVSKQGFHFLQSPISDLKFHFDCDVQAVGVYRATAKLRDGGEIPERQDGQALRSKGADKVHGVDPSSHGVAGMVYLGAEHAGHVAVNGHTPKHRHQHYLCFTESPRPIFNDVCRCPS